MAGLLESLLGKVRNVSTEGLERDVLEVLWEGERWFDTPRQLEGLLKGFEAAGLPEPELVPYATDGETRYQDWMTRLSWECREAWLRFADDSTTFLADRSIQPAAVVMGSGPLGARGEPFRGAVIDGDRDQILEPYSAANSYLLTRRNPQELKRLLLGTPPAAIVSDFQQGGEERGYSEDTTAWINGWGDDLDGWYVHAQDTVRAGFVISPKAGHRLRQSLARNPDLELEGLCRSRLFAGEAHCLTDVIKGCESDREVWIFAHGYEQGANDNCSGVATVITAFSTIATLVERGDLPPPRRTIRVIVTEECLGMAAFATIRDEARRRALCGLNVDSVGQWSSPARPLDLELGPLSNPGFGWAIAGLTAETLMSRWPDSWFARSSLFVPTADDMIADPACGIPTAALGHGKRSEGYHSSADVPATCSSESLALARSFVACWAYTMASLDDETAPSLVTSARGWLEQELIYPQSEGGERVELLRWAAAGALRDLEHFGVSSQKYESAASHFAPRDTPPIGGIEQTGTSYRRSLWGTSTLETVSLDKRRGLSRWNEPLHAALFWIGRGCSVETAARLARVEAGELSTRSLSRFLECCCEAGCLVPEGVRD